jgi:RHS repeat-associated protein
MKLTKPIIVFVILFGISNLLRAQTSPSLENGWKPFGSYEGSHLDTVNLMNGNLMFHAPIIPDIPGRGTLGMHYSLFGSSKDWQVLCTPVPDGQLWCRWVKGGSGVQILIAPGLSVHRTLSTIPTDDEGDTVTKALGYTIGDANGTSHQVHGVPGTEDGYGEATQFDSVDLSGYHLTMSVADPDFIQSVPVLTHFIVTDRAGNQYQGDFADEAGCGSPGQHTPPPPGARVAWYDDTPGGTQNCSQSAFAYLIMDSNGNKISPNSPQNHNPTVDTLGKNPPLSVPVPNYSTTDSSGCVTSHPFYSAAYFSYIDPNGVTQTIKVCYAEISIQTAFGQANVDEAVWNPTTTNHFYAPVNIILADGNKWTFDYDNYGELASVGLPTGGSLSYTWETVDFINCNPFDNARLSRAVLTRTLDDGQGHISQWRYNWGTPSSTSVVNKSTDPLGNDTLHTFSELSSLAGLGAHCHFYETSTSYYQGAQSPNNLLQQVDTSFSAASMSVDNAGGLHTDLANVFATDVVTTVYPSGKVKKVHKDPDTGLGAGQPIFGNVKKELEYDWGQGTPGGLLRETDTTYQSEVNSAYLTARLVDLPASVVVKDGAGNRVAETDYSYDEPGYLTTPNPAITTQHGAPPASVRGNQTTVSRWLNTTNSFIASHTNWYDTGEVYKSIDPLGHTTTHSYDPFYVGAYATQTCSPTTNGVAHCVSGTYDFNTGLLTSLTNENAATQANGNTPGDSAHTSTYTYDSMFRITSGQAPPDPANSNLRATTSFNFSFPNTFPVSVQRTKSVTAALSDSATSFFDGLGRGYQSQHVLPNGTAKVDTTFDLAGHPATVSNPYFTTSDPTYGNTANTYDGLDRVTQTTKQDGSISRVAYSVLTSVAANGDCTVTTDEAGKQRGACSDALGRLVEVDEPSGAVVQANYHGLMQQDGNFVLLNSAGTSVWSTGTAATNAVSMFMQDDGNLVTYIFKWQAGVYAAPTPGSYPVSSCSIGTYLIAGEILPSGKCIVSPHGQYFLLMNTDGNFFIYDWAHGTGTWGPGTQGHPGAYAIFQTDGNLVVYDVNGTALWNSGTSGTYAERLNLEDDGRIIIYKSAWNSGTSNGQFNGTTYTHPSCDVGIGTGTTGLLWSGQCFVSPNGRFELLMQADGNMVIYDRSVTPNAPIWSTGTGFSTADPSVAYRTLYFYDALGNLTCVEQHGDSPAGPHGDGTAGTGCSADPSNDAISTWRVRRFTYDSLSRLLTAKNPESGTITYTYDADGNLLQKTSPAPNQTGTATQTVSYCYDELHRVTGKGYGAQSCPLATPIVSYAYDSGANAKGKLTSLTDQAGIATYAYDILGRLTTETRPIAGISKSTSYTYNLEGSVKTLTYPSGRVVTYTPDSAGRLVSAVDGNGTNYVTSANYNADGSLKSLSNGSTPALSQNFQYTPRLQLCRITTLTSGTLPTSCTDSQHVGNIMDRGYDFHAGNGTAGSGADNGNVFTITNYRDANRSQAFTYDALNRLTSGWSSANTGSYSWGENYSIDAWGNLQIAPMSGKAHGGNFTLSGNAQNRPTGMNYDAAGNLLSYLTANYSYDQESRLLSAGGMTYTYDGNGERVLKSQVINNVLTPVKRYWTMGGNTLAEGDGTGNLAAEYIYFGGKRIARIDLPANIVHYYMSDHLGSTSIVASATGTVEEESDYYPFGTEVIVTGPGVNELKFTGKRRDTESQLDYFGARYYSTSFGRFNSIDPLLNSAHPANPQSWNRYTYALNNPLKVIDPTGLYNLTNTCKSGDSKCNKQFEQHAKDLKKGLGDLQKKVDKMKDGVEKQRLQGSLAKLGTENDGNNVSVKFGSVAGGAGHTDVVLDASGKPSSFTITLDTTKLSDSNEYAISSAHEGTHINNFSDPRYASNPLSDFQDEYRAYQTSAWAAQALGLGSLGFGGNVVWNSSWKEADRQTLMDKGITKEIKDHYHYQDTQPDRHNPWPD